MTVKPLDLKSIRRNWERSAATLQGSSPDRLESVPPPLDAYVAGAQLIERLRLELRDEFPEQQAALGPFFHRVASALEQLRARARAGESDASELALLREQLSAALADLEDICEAFLGWPR